MKVYSKLRQRDGMRAPCLTTTKVSIRANLTVFQIPTPNEFRLS